MMLVATLAANPDAPCLTDALLRAAVQAAGTGAASAWLAAGIAADVIVSGKSPAALTAAIRNALGDAQIDVIAQPMASRRKALFLADMDSTMIGQECIDELAAHVGLKERVSEITERAMRGELDFEPALRERVGLLKGVPTGVVDEIIRDQITLTPGGTTLVRTMRANGGYTALVSGGFTVFTGPIHAVIGFDEHRSNILDANDGKLSGTVREPILGRQAKLDTLIELRSRFALSPKATMAVGDGANDLAMLGEAGLGIAFRAKPAVAAAAHARVDHADLTALLYAQGYTQADFIN